MKMKKLYIAEIIVTVLGFIALIPLYSNSSGALSYYLYSAVGEGQSRSLAYAEALSKVPVGYQVYLKLEHRFWVDGREKWIVTLLCRKKPLRQSAYSRPFAIRILSHYG